MIIKTIKKNGRGICFSSTSFQNYGALVIVSYDQSERGRKDTMITGGNGGYLFPCFTGYVFQDTLQTLMSCIMYGNC